MSLVRVPIYPTRNLATEIDPGARTINAGTNVSFSVQPDGSITINASGGGAGTVTSVGLAAPTGFSVSGSPVTTSGTLTLAYAAGYTGYTTAEQTKLAGIAPGAQPGTVTSVGATGSTGLTVGGSPITTSGTLTFTLSANLQSWSGIAPATKANLASPVFTGDPRAPTPATADNDTSIATTAFVKNQGYATTASLGSYVLKAGDTMTGSLLINSGGLSTRNAGQVKVYDSNNDTPIELGLGFGSSTDRNGYLWNRNNGFLSFGTNNIERMRIQAGGNVVTTGGAFIVQDNDIYTYRTGGTTGVIFLNSGGTKYLYNDGTRYQMPAQGLQVGGPIYSDFRWLEGTSGGEGFQIVWNTVQAGQGRTEIINNRGGGGGGFTWWDRANTGAGTGTALAALTSAGMFVNGVVQFNTVGTSIGQLTAWPGNSSYVSLGTTTMGGTEYALLTANPSVDTNTYISSPSGGTVKIRPSANSTVGEATFSTSGLSLAKYVWPDANTAGSKKLSRISIGTAAPSGLIDGELYLRY